jgi:hypothetical protein
MTWSTSLPTAYVVLLIIAKAGKTDGFMGTGGRVKLGGGQAYDRSSD